MTQSCFFLLFLLAQIQREHAPLDTMPINAGAATGSIKIKQGTAEREIKAMVFDIGGTLIGHHDYVNFTESDNPIRFMNPGAFELLSFLAHEKRVKLSIASNTRIEPNKVIETFARMGFTEEHFVIIALSSDITIGKGKPSKFIYRVVRRALRKTGIEPHETLFVGDHYRNDVVKPRRFGMATVYLAAQDKDDAAIERAHKARCRHATFRVPDVNGLWGLARATGLQN
jgi:FMN phosphatase YigB (HAD superfamily)